MDKHTTAERLEEGLRRIILLVTRALAARWARSCATKRRGTTAGGAGCQSADPPDPDPVYRGDAGTPDSGSGTVAMITAASISARRSRRRSRYQYVACRSGRNDGVVAVFGYFNDSLFWVVNRMMGVLDVKQQIGFGLYRRPWLLGRLAAHRRGAD